MISIVYSFSFDPEGVFQKMSTRFEVSASDFWIRNVKTRPSGVKKSVQTIKSGGLQ
jgi:hypothetical protein